MKRGRAAVFCLAAAALSCGKHTQVTLPPPTPARIGAIETGVASWYGHPYHGRKTSNGEVYDMHQMTAAHLSLPFDTMVRVTNTSNARSADVRINDRGPFRKGRLIDLSRAAAEQIGMIGTGTAEVRVEVIATPEMTRSGAWKPVQTEARTTTAPPPVTVEGCQPSTYAVQVGSYRDPQNAEAALAGIAERYGQARIVQAATPAGLVHRVVVGAPDAVGARGLLDRLSADGVSGLVIRLDETLPCVPADAS